MTARDAPPVQIVRLHLNGTPLELAADPSRRLADVLRDDLGLIGTKIGCHAGDCGACTVLLDGEPVCACIVALGTCGERSVTTVEGLAAPGASLTALQQAFVDHGAAQCGVCTPGMLMSAEALLRAHPHPDEAAVIEALAGVLCRCTGYRKIVEAVLSVGRGTPSPAAPPPAAGQAVGARVVRLDADAKVRGVERFGADRLPGTPTEQAGAEPAVPHRSGLPAAVPPMVTSPAMMPHIASLRAAVLEMRVIRSPHAHATFELGDLSGFIHAWPGLVDVVSAADVPHNAFAIFPDLRDQPVFADGEVRFAGEAVLGLVGTAEVLAAIPEAAVPIRYRPLAALAGIDAALDGALGGTPGEGPVQARYPDNVLCRGRVVCGDVEGAIDRAALVVEAGFETVHVEHAYIEPEAGYAEWVDAVDAAGGAAPRLRVWACTQTPYMDRDEIAQVLGLAPDRVHVVPSAIGGGFGGKLDLSVQPLLAVAAWKLRRAVRLVYERPESMQSSTKRHPARMRARAACDATGRLTAFDFHGDFDTGAYSSWGPTVANRVPIHACGPYRIANVRATTRAVLTHGSIGGAFRGFGVPQSTLIGERLIDELAERLGIDALEFRHRNALVAGDSTATGQVLAASVGLRACLDALRPAWAAAKAAASAFNAQGGAGQAGSSLGALRRGAGIACMWYGIGNTVIANPSTLRASLRFTAARGAHLFLYNGAQEIGQGAATVIPQMLADAVGLPLAAVEQVVGDTDLTADAGKSSASRQTFVSGNAVKAAGEALRRQLLQALGLADRPDDEVSLQLDGDRLVGLQSGARQAVALRELPAGPQGDLFIASGSFNPSTVPLDDDGQGVPYATYGFAAQIAEVEVDLELGTVRLLHIHAAHDVGRAINPTQVEGQIHGGIAQGIGMALMEEYANGRTDNLHDYLIPTAGDVPPITVHLIEDPEPLGPWGAKGVGEPALVATAPAILSAIHAATGVRMSRVPVTPSRLRAAIVAAGACTAAATARPIEAGEGIDGSAGPGAGPCDSR